MLDEISYKFQGLSSTDCNFQGLSRPWIFILKFKNFQGLSRRVRTLIRCHPAKVTLNKRSLVELNDYFADLCWDTAYTCLSGEWSPSSWGLRKTGVELFEALKENRHGTRWQTFLVVEAEIFTPIICKIWNLSLKFSTWPLSWKRAHVIVQLCLRWLNTVSARSAVLCKSQRGF